MTGLGGIYNPLKAEAITVAPLFFIASNNYRTMQEEFRDIPDWEGYYQVSDLANVKSLEREFLIRGKHPATKKEHIMKLNLNGGYYTVGFFKKKRRKTFRISVLVAMAFLGHKPCGHKIVVDHKDNVKTHDYLSNLQLITNRENCTKDKKRGSSIYTGVSWAKRVNKWEAKIRINGKSKFLGYFDNELDASKAYQKALNEHEND